MQTTYVVRLTEYRIKALRVGSRAEAETLCEGICADKNTPKDALEIVPLRLYYKEADCKYIVKFGKCYIHSYKIEMRG